MNQRDPIATSRTDTALTFVELVLVIIVIPVILWVLPPPHAGKGTSTQIVDMSNLREIGNLMADYAYDHDGWLPQHPRDAMKYFGEFSGDDHNFWLNPYQGYGGVIDRGDFEGTAIRFGGYVFLNLGVELEEIENQSERIVAYTATAPPRQTTRNVLFADGHVESWDEDRLRATLPESVDVDALDGP